MDQPPKIILEKYAKTPSTPKDDADDLLSLAQRPIATNSRVRQGERFKRDMFIAFIQKALQEKLNVRGLVCMLHSADLFAGPQQRL